MLMESRFTWRRSSLYIEIYYRSPFLTLKALRKVHENIWVMREAIYSVCYSVWLPISVEMSVPNHRSVSLWYICISYRSSKPLINVRQCSKPQIDIAPPVAGFPTTVSTSSHCLSADHTTTWAMETSVMKFNLQLTIFLDSLTSMQRESCNSWSRQRESCHLWSR